MFGLIKKWYMASSELSEIHQYLETLGMVGSEYEETTISGVRRLADAFFNSQADYLTQIRINEDLSDIPVTDTLTAARDHPHPPARSRSRVPARERAKARDREEAFAAQFALRLSCRKCGDDFDSHVLNGSGEYVCVPNL